MNVQQKNKEKGFTIIEVVLVLAIAGLIFLMVFIALPALQRSQRDTQRRDDVSRFVSQLTSYSTNNRGNLPADGSGTGSIQEFLTDYMRSGDSEFKDPQSGDNYTVGDTATVKQIRYDRGSNCEGATNVGNRQAAVSIKLESGGDFCQNAK